MLRKKIRGVGAFLALAMALMACGGGSIGGEAKAPPSSTQPQPAAYPSAAGGGSFESSGAFNAPPGAPASPPPPADVSTSTPSSTSRKSADAAEPSPAKRPGLGTEWGESRVSRVHDVSFVRDAGRPFALAEFRYDDKKGVDALASMQQRRDTSRSISSGGGAVTVSLKDQSGDALEAVHVGDRTFVVGQAGQRYTIVLENHTSHRFEAVATVDGLDVINGKDGSFDNRGYVLMPFATLEIEGFRQSSNAVAAFRFASVGDSYAAQVGKARNVGVIGIAFFGERGDSFVPQSELKMRDTASPFPADPRFAPPPPR